MDHATSEGMHRDDDRSTRRARRAGLGLACALTTLGLACATPRYRFDRLDERRDGVEVRDLADLIADGRASDLGVRASELAPEFTDPRHEYRLGRRDVLRIDVPGHPELGSPQDGVRESPGTVVEPDGCIPLAVARAVKAEGLTLGELRAALREALARFVQRPDLQIAITRYESQKFFVLGQVQRPAALPVDGATTLIEALAAAGGVTPTGDLESAYVLRDGKLLPISLADLVLRGDVARNIAMRHGDVVYVPDNADKKIFVLGEVARPTVVPLPRGRITLAEGIAAAGGPTPAAARRELAILRGGHARPIVYTVDLEKALLHDHEIVLKPGDRVVLAPTGLATSSRYMEQINPFLRGVQAIGIATSGAANVAGQAAAIQP